MLPPVTTDMLNAEHHPFCCHKRLLFKTKRWFRFNQGYNTNNTSSSREMKTLVYISTDLIVIRWHRAEFWYINPKTDYAIGNKELTPTPILSITKIVQYDTPTILYYRLPSHMKHFIWEQLLSKWQVYMSQHVTNLRTYPGISVRGNGTYPRSWTPEFFQKVQNTLTS